MKVIKRERNQAIALNLGRKCRQYRSGRFSRGPALQTTGCAGHWGHEGYKKGEKPGHCAKLGKEMQTIQKW